MLRCDTDDPASRRIRTVEEALEGKVVGFRGAAGEHDLARACSRAARIPADGHPLPIAVPPARPGERSTDSRRAAAPAAWRRGRARRAPWWRCCRGRCPSCWLGRPDMNVEVPVECLSELFECAELRICLTFLHARDRRLCTADPFGELTLAEASTLAAAPGARGQSSTHRSRSMPPGHTQRRRPAGTLYHHSPDAMAIRRQRPAPTQGPSGSLRRSGRRTVL